MAKILPPLIMSWQLHAFFSALLKLRWQDLFIRPHKHASIYQSLLTVSLENLVTMLSEPKWYRVAYDRAHDMGKSLVATQDIPARTRIATVKPCLRAQMSILARDAPTMLHEADMKATVELLPHKRQNLFLKLTNYYNTYEDDVMGNFFTTPYPGTVRSNALPLSLCPDSDGFDEFGVFLETSKLDHSCRPMCS